ncbi:ferric reductase-like transmembrane domain-containing protein [Coraliomargarita algicola]|uniref:Ferric reductase-like transmembrane domain-containing protein n=1 Tax=Coraliomargarita algicola TaxID=3092156 RepID=A0ABZ0RPL9_9BACT|nr:ferric reductase-like transmembrane domain-containing protein [Coraliomargarita sp. J2-16]WPJ97058.1 ferric reductase-like transmembrane domain-containing protein [Coraliomargarita sp. J2-16]
MNRWLFIVCYSLLFVGAPIFLALTQGIPSQSNFQLAVLLVSVGAFGLTLGLFWLTRLLPKDSVKMRLGKMMSWHKYLGYAVCIIFMIHPILIIARRFWVVESNPIHNLKLMLTAPLVWPGMAAWLLLMLIMGFALARKRFSAKTFRNLHGWLSIAFLIFAAWHVISIGRHSDLILAAFWGLLAAAAIVGYFNRALLKKRTS